MPEQNEMNMSEDTKARREKIRTRENPDPGHDYLCEMRRQVIISRPNEHRVTMVLRYVPDAEVLSTFDMEAYFDFLTEQEWHSLEAMALAVLEDINNELIPRWAQVSVAFKARRDDAISSEVTVEDHQPDWKNPYMMERINLMERQLKF